MKHIFTIALFSIIYTSAFAQYEKVLMTYGSPNKPRWILNCTDDTQQDCILQSYYPDRSVQGEAKIAKMDSYFRPIGDMIIYFPNGKVFQEYDHETGTLLTYYPSGELEEKMVTPINGDMEYKYKYYKTGQVWEEEQAKREPGKQNLSYGHSNNRDKIYDNTGYSYNYFKTFHPNGNLQSMIFIDADAPTFRYAAQYYSPEGQLDTFSNYLDRYAKRINKGNRYDYHSNGQLREISVFDDLGQITGEQYRWAENGQLVWKTQYLNSSRHGKLETWWDNGRRKEVSYYYGSYKAGPILKWHHDGRILEQGSYYNDKAVGVATIWDTLGGVSIVRFGSIEVENINVYYTKRYIDDKTVWLTSEGDFKDGMRDGEWQFFYAKRGEKKEPINGICAKVTYKNGLLDGKAFVYFPDGSLCLEANFKDGLLHGDYVSKREGGFFAAKGHFENHKKNGLWTTYHYNSHQIYRIDFFEDNVQKETYGEWENDGFQKQERIDNKEKKQIEYWTYYPDGMKIKHVVPYGRKNMDTYEYDKSGYLKKVRLLIADNPSNYEQTEYYPSGQKSTFMPVVNGKNAGIYWAWYESGQMKMEVPYENTKRHGESKEWNEDGKLTTVRYFENGIQVNIEAENDALLECACNHPPKEVSNRFMQWFLSYVPLEKVEKRTVYYTISETSYKRLFAQNIQQYDDRVWGELAVLNDFYVDVHNGLRLNFTPCRRGVNRTNLAISGDFNKSRNQAEITVSDFDLSVEFPTKLLRPYDIENDKPIFTKIEKYQYSSVRFSVKQLVYNDDGKYPTIKMQTNGNGNPCFQIAEIGETRTLFTGINPQVDFSPMSTVDLPWENAQKATEKGYLFIDKKQHYLVPPQKYLNGFIGVYFPEGKIYIPYNDGRITAEAKHIFVSGMEIYGNIEIISNEKIPLDMLKRFPKYMESMGFEVLEEEIEDDEILRIFWRYVM